MREPLADIAFVVVVIHGKRDVSRTTWVTAAEAERYMERLRKEGIPAEEMRLYRVRLARSPTPPGLA